MCAWLPCSPPSGRPIPGTGVAGKHVEEFERGGRKGSRLMVRGESETKGKMTPNRWLSTLHYWEGFFLRGGKDARRSTGGKLGLKGSG